MIFLGNNYLSLLGVNHYILCNVKQVVQRKICDLFVKSHHKYYLIPPCLSTISV